MLLLGPVAFERFDGNVPVQEKSSGVRVIYFARVNAGELVLLTLYAKSKLGNLKASQLKEIRRALED